MDVEPHKKTHVIGSYNMSFASDLGITIGSEKQFLARLKNEDDKRKYWKNAAQQVKEFFKQKTPSFVGFQEMNDADEVGPGKGFQELLKLLGNSETKSTEKEQSDNKNSNYKKYGKINDNYQWFSYSTYTKFGYPTVLSIINTTKVGNIKFEKSFGLDIDKSGRPLSVVFTTEGYTLINLHGPNSKKASAEKNFPVVEELKKIVEEYKNLIEANKFFIVGDFNDPYNSLTSLELGKDKNDKSITLTYKGPAPKSCCYNFDSSCPDENFGINGQKNTNVYNNSIVNEKYDDFQGISEDFVNKTCVTRISRETDDKQNINLEELEQFKDATLEELRNNSDLTEKDISKIEEELNTKNGQELKKYIAELRSQDLKNTAIGLKTRGSIENYRFTGDYTFGQNPLSNLEIVTSSNNEKISTRSDHEMVFSIYSITSIKDLTAGGVKRKIKRKSRKSNKSKKTRKSNKKVYKHHKKSKKERSKRRKTKRKTRK